MSKTEPNRCRLVLAAGPRPGMETERVLAALEGGDVASLVLVQDGAADDAFQAWAEAIVPAAQARGVATIVSGDTRVAGRVGADGIHVEENAEAVADAVRKHQGRLIVGAGGAKTRHDALELGEAQPDYVFFGRFFYDNQPDPHPRNLGLAEWWAQIVEVPCIVLGGASIESVVASAATGAEFVALSSAVFGEGDPAEQVRAANALLDAQAPRFET